jgi:hypothetical protein
MNILAIFVRRDFGNKKNLKHPGIKNRCPILIDRFNIHRLIAPIGMDEKFDCCAMYDHKNRTKFIRFLTNYTSMPWILLSLSSLLLLMLLL